MRLISISGFDGWCAEGAEKGLTNTTFNRRKHIRGQVRDERAGEMGTPIRECLDGGEVKVR